MFLMTNYKRIKLKLDNKINKKKKKKLPRKAKEEKFAWEREGGGASNNVQNEKKLYVN